MGLFDLFDDAKESMEKKSKARGFLRDAKRYTEEGKNIYDNAYLKVFDYSMETNSRIKKHINYKKDIARELNKNIEVTINEASNLEYKSSDYTLSSTSGAGIEISNSSNIFSSAIQSCMPTGGADVPSILDMFISDEEYYDAMRQRDEAKHFKEMMKIEKQNLYVYKDRMSVIRDYIYEEKSQLDQLMDKLKTITTSIENHLRKEKISNCEVDYVKGINLIAVQIVEMLKSDFLAENFAISNEYISNLEKIKVINNTLPSAPEIRNSETFDYLGVIQDVIVN